MLNMLLNFKDRSTEGLVNNMVSLLLKCILTGKLQALVPWEQNRSFLCSPDDNNSSYPSLPNLSDSGASCKTSPVISQSPECGIGHYKVPAVLLVFGSPLLIDAALNEPHSMYCREPQGPHREAASIRVSLLMLLILA